MGMDSRFIGHKGLQRLNRPPLHNQGAGGAQPKGGGGIIGFRFAIILSAVLFWVGSARGALGDREDFKEQNRSVSTGVRSQIDTLHYVVREIAAKDGTQIKEYAVPQGKVFAVTWKGAFVPSFENLMGGYFSDYKNHEDQARRIPGQRVGRLKTSNLIFLMGGHMRDLHGKVYVPDLVPSSVNPEDLQ